MLGCWLLANPCNECIINIPVLQNILITFNHLGLPLSPSFCRALVSDRDSPDAPCVCPSTHDLVRPPRRRRPHHRNRLPFRPFLLVRRVHDRDLGRHHDRARDDRESDHHVCHVLRGRAEDRASRCDSDFDCEDSGRRRTRTISRGACCQKTRVSRASFLSFLARKDPEKKKEVGNVRRAF